MANLRWVDKTQPQTLMMATIILYINAALDLIGGLFTIIGIVLVVGQVAAGIGIANEKKWGYWLGVTMVVLSLGQVILYFGAISIISLLFYGALLALLLHPQSRNYRRVWFK